MTTSISLDVWDKAHAIALDVYHRTQVFADRGLAECMQRTAEAIPVQLAIGCGRPGDAGLESALQKSLDAAYELACYLRLAHELGLLPAAAYDALEIQLVDIEICLETMTERLAPQPLPDWWRQPGQAVDAHRWLYAGN